MHYPKILLELKICCVMCSIDFWNNIKLWDLIGAYTYLYMYYVNDDKTQLS